MATELGITAGAYAKIERGETDPSATRLLRIAEILGVDVYTFFHDNQLRVASRLEEPGSFYGTASKSDILGLADMLQKMNREIEKIKTELEGLKKEPAKKSR